MHLAEQVAEVEEVLEVWGKRPAEWAVENLPINSQWCLIHCTQMLPHEVKDLAATGAIAGLCPITESNLGDGIFDGFILARGFFGVSPSGGPGGTSALKLGQLHSGLGS